MKTLLIIFLLLLPLLNAKEIHPTFKLKSMGLVNDFTVVKDKIYIANSAGTVDIFDLNSGKLVEQIIIDLVTTRMNKLVSPNVLSVDYKNGKVLIVSMGVDSYRNVWIYENHKLTKTIDEDKKLTIKEARFVNDEKIILSTFASQIVLHDIGEHYNLYNQHISQSTLGDITLSEDKKRVVMSDESGKVRLIDVKTSKTLKTFSSQNVDNVYHLAFAKGVIITAGQDRRVAVYQDGIKDYHIKSDFLVYCVGISPSSNIGIYSKGEKSNLQLFDTKNGNKTDELVGHSGIVNHIKFINENELFSSDRGYYVYFWRLDKGI